ncbi:MAG: hypothetical protein Q8L22_21295 [Reyranella sp.]|nr:hypothetical protein [Reyranella sp.]
MARGAQLLTTSRKAAILAVALTVAACARNSPPLPPDLGHLPPAQRLLQGDAESPEAKLGCPELKEESERIRMAASQNEATIAGNRSHNQTVSYVGGALFAPLLLAARNDDDAKKNLDELQTKKDRVDRLLQAKGC